jgi:CRP/FNR family transcriptional regulator
MIPAFVLSPLMKKNPKIEAYLYKTATERFADVVWTMQQILFLSTDKRVAIFLWDEISRTGQTTLSVTHDEIARYIGSAREVVTKVLKYFAEEGIVILSRGKIKIKDQSLLKKYL